jgi:signal transduction histidine kinase
MADSDTGTGVASPDMGAPVSGTPTGLSTKLLFLTILFVMVAEVLIYVPSVANFRLTWLKERLVSAQIASLALEAAPGLEVSSDLARELLTNAGVLAVVLERGDARRLILRSEMPPPLDQRYDLRRSMPVLWLTDAFATLFAGPGRVIGVVDTAPNGGGERIEIIIREAPLKSAMVRFSVNVLSLSLSIAVITAVLVYLALNWLMVRPIRRLTRSMMLFSESPEDASRVIEPSGRDDEIGRAETELAQMQRQLHSMLQQKGHLAALGLAVSKINHDLRNLLAHAQLMSDRLRMIKDPAVERLVPKLVVALDRAVELCSNTLKFGKAQEAPPDRRRFALAPLVDEVGEMGDAGDTGPVRFLNLVPSDLEIDADRDQLFRILSNLVRNAVQALDRGADPRVETAEVRVDARREGSVVAIEVADNGPGVPDRVRANLFEAFRGSASPGGIGLGLAIAAELTRLHGGEIELVDGTPGARFRVTIPDAVARIGARRRAPG